jgi:hypothetical protein
MANALSWGIGMDFGNPYPSGQFTDTIFHTEQQRIFDIAMPSDKFGPSQVESPTLQHPLGDDLGLDDFQPIILPHHKSGAPSPTSDAWKQNFISNTETAKSSNQLNKSDSPLSEHQREEAYFQLGFFYRVKPHLTTKQLEALAIVVELSYDEVQAFYQQKKSQPPLYVAHSLQFRHGQSRSISRSAKRFRSSDLSSSPEPINTSYKPSRSDSSASLQTSERSAIARTPSLNLQARELSQKTYECTWRACLMSFASKSDWKRHEEVHCPQWEWICTFTSQSAGKSSNVIPCSRLPFKRSDHLREHLRKDHKCTDVSRVEAGRQCIIPENSFNKQCGFCGQITRNWLDRIDHIAEHFKNGKNMSEWTDPWREDVFEEESTPSDGNDDDDHDDESGNGDANGTEENKSNPTSQNQDHARSGSGKDSRRDFNMVPRSGGYHGKGYRRPGTFVIKYRTSSPGMDSPGSHQRDDNDSLRRELDSRSSFWSKMRNMLKDRNSQKETSLATSLNTTKATSLEASQDIVRKDTERIEVYCILCTRRVSMDPSLPITDDYHCACSEAAIKEHIMSVALAGLHINAPSTKISEEGTQSERQSDNREKALNNMTMAARERGIAGTKPQSRAALEHGEEQFSHSVQRYTKTIPALEHLLELNQDENSWVEVHRSDSAGSKSEDHANSQARPKAGKFDRVRGSNHILHSMQSSPELWHRTHGD